MSIEDIRSAKKREAFKCTDTGNAERFAVQQRDRARYVGAWRQWLIWDGKRWRPDDTCTIDLLAKETARSIDDEVARETDDEERKKLRTHAAKTESRFGRESMVALARAELAISHEELDRDPWLFNVNNGTIDLRTGKLHPHRREDMITRVADITYDASATCPTFVAFITKALKNDPELINYVQKAVGYSLTGNVHEKCFFFMHGPTDTGKTTFGEILLKICGPYAKVTGPDLLMARDQEQHLTWIADLQGARLAICQEVAEGKRWNERLLKHLTGGDAITANRMRKDPFTFDPSHALWIAGNYKPKMQESGDATWNRVRLLPFEVQIPKAEQDKTLKSKMFAELAGILGWAVEGCLKWQREGLTAPAAVMNATSSYREESDHITTFVEDRLVFGDESKVVKAELYEAYTLWCKQNREAPMSRNELQKRLLARDDVTESRKGQRMLLGIGLRSGGPTSNGASEQKRTHGPPQWA
jgi:putative DNA primase/helicase